ncbi:hypothetical protein ABT039_22980 [Streptomyces lasiicapitis]|uniref:hypothetical protein n=1 Tax=Streptomyces TaxID=1883 RepID=UPI0013DB9A7F|nr:hypothetical protein [Streptomyces aureoverticillatus]QIB42626.1 hypothetical protein G3H79_05625 [Streptomyces aureoverticillatus]
MRLSAPHLAMTLTTAALCTLAATPSAYAGDATAEVTPKHAAPGEQVTISVTCPATGGSPPQTMNANSQAFEHGTVQLQRAQHHEQTPQHQPNQSNQHSQDGTTQYDESNENGQYDEGGGRQDETGQFGGIDGFEEPLASFDAQEGLTPSDGLDPSAGIDSSGGLDPSGTTGLQGPGAAAGGIAYHGTARVAAAQSFEGGGPNAVGSGSEWAVDGTCHGDGQWKATFTVTRSGHTSTHKPDHTSPAAARGVHAGREGGFSDSPAALAAGALLVVGALGAAVHRLRRDRAYPR